MGRLVFPEGTEALVRTAGPLGCDLDLVKAAISVNAQHNRRVLDKVISVLDGQVTGKRVALWGTDLQGGNGRPAAVPGSRDRAVPH